ncbi:MAG: restriction endonuclease subunit S [Candidatus Acidiferrales bacterium]
MNETVHSRPNGWVRTTLGELNPGRNETVDPRKAPDEMFELYSVPAFPTGRFEVLGGAEIGSSKQKVETGTVLLCGINPRINRVWVVSESEGKRQIASTEWIAFKPKAGLVAKYLCYFLRQDKVRDYLAGYASGVGGSLMRVKGRTCADIELPLAPSNEQARIVSEIEKQFTRLDAAVGALKRAQGNLKRYRAAVLKAAVEGRLVPTEAELARREGRPYEPASELLKRILVERRARWEAAQLAKFRAAGKQPKDDTWKAKYEELERLDSAKLPTLAEGWTCSPLGFVADLKGGLTKGQKRKASEILLEVPYLRVANMQRGILDLSEMKTIQATEEEITELRLFPGDVLFNEGGDRDKLGRGWIWESQIQECIHQNHVFRARLIPDTILPKFLSWFGNSVAQRYFNDEGKQTTNLASLNMTKLSALPVPIPPFAEQGRIVIEVELRLSIIDELKTEVEADLKRAERLRQAILKRAFEGKLVPQDPGDEPASILLNRIRAERENAVLSARKTSSRREALHAH